MNGKLYFLVIFGINWKWKYSWTFGKPFMKKYNLLFDQDGKEILYYNEKSNINNSVIGNKKFVFFLWGGIVVLLVIIGILTYFLVLSSSYSIFHF